ncbi:Serine/arginine repetitive matrix protein isoform 2 [Schistosoma japonicum]|uniref:Serine/arginine repetitive matrix protein isoform 2 n=1 Tax=Schistosoma japonicum TaxID=6182 RepID=A0A4Z2CUZ2_SCHJA|nr:Serine/arginine repetitive matrix protein isoform 2 [Schistosoma japonicum]
MYNGIGLPTPRGSGTNGYVQKNLAFISNFKEQNQYKTDEDIKKADALLFKEPNKEILEHERKRKIEVKCFEMEQEMEEQGYTQGEIEFRVSGFRKKLLDELKASETKKVFNVEPFEISQSEHGKLLPKGTHETAAVNILKNTVFKEALGIGEQFQDGNSVELAVQRKKDDAETKRLVEAQKELKYVFLTKISNNLKLNTFNISELALYVGICLPMVYRLLFFELVSGSYDSYKNSCSCYS